MSLQGKTLFITGASRGIGLAIALRAAREGANIVIAAKTTEAHPKLPGTIFSAARQIEEAGGQALPVKLDIRNEGAISTAVEAAVKRFGGIDICINNASAISLSGTIETDVKRLDLMMKVNVRGTFLVSRECIPYLLESDNPHILNISPPLDMNPRWFAPHLAYTIAKYGMSLCVLGMAEEYRGQIAVNALWPHTTIATSVVAQNSSSTGMEASRKPAIMADAACAVISRPRAERSGRFLIDAEILRAEGVHDLSHYRQKQGGELALDLFLDEKRYGLPSDT